MLVTLDFESAFGTSPTGRKVTVRAMTTEEYVRDPEFLVHGVGIKINVRPTRYFYGHQVEQIFRLIPWDQVYLLCHHAQFDGAILAWRYGIYPKFYLDTISMAQALYNHVPASLEYLSEFLGVGTKGKELQTVKDKWVLAQEEQKVLGDYCIQDVELTYRLFQAMKKGYPVSELETIDDTIWMFTNPMFEINTVPLVPAYAQEIQRKKDLVAATGRDKGEFTSNQKFAALLESRGVTVPMKLNPKGEEAYAFAKTDEEFLALEFHADLVVQNYVKARLGTKTSIVETRIKRFIEIGGRGKLPCYLKPSSAKTFRWGGGDKSNLQNLSNRGTGLVIRESIEAPEGHMLCIIDSSQIECRLLNTMAGQTDRVEMFRSGGDPYNDMASDLYGEPVDRKRKILVHPAGEIDVTKSKDKEIEDLLKQFGGKVTQPHKKQGNIGKAVTLGAGYGMGWFNFQAQLRVGFLGMEGVVYGQEYVEQLRVDVDSFRVNRSYDDRYKTLEEQALSGLPLGMDSEEHIIHCAVVWTIVNMYREKNPRVKALWKLMNNALAYMMNGQEVQIGPVKTVKDGLLMPNGLVMKYEGLRRSKSGEYSYLKQVRPSGYQEWVKTYGGSIVENICQCLSRILISDSITSTRKAGYNVALTVHDEQVSVVPTEQAHQCASFVKHRLCTPPSWMPDLPLDASIDIVKNYAEAK